MSETHLIYDEPALISKLSRLDPKQRAAFAAAAAERLVPAYEAFHDKTGGGDPRTLRAWLDAVWGHLIEREELVIADHLDVVDSLTPSESEEWSVVTGLAENAAVAVSYAIDAALGCSAQDAAWAARQLYEAADLWVRTRDDVDFNVSGAEATVLADPIVQSELRRQARDLDQLERSETDLLPRVAADLRLRSQAEATAFIADAV